MHNIPQHIIMLKTFMGEVIVGGKSTDNDDGVLEGSVGDVTLDDDDVVFSDDDDDDELDEEEDKQIAEGGGDSEVSNNQRRRQRLKRKQIEDWVVKAFATKNVRAAVAKNNIKAPPSASSSNIWEEVERDAILAAAWESRAAEQRSTLANHRGSTRPNNLSRMGTTKSNSGDSDDDDLMEIATASSSISSSSGYGSKMFQSVMTRVGTNGRIFGAYPNDAPPINECANERGGDTIGTTVWIWELERSRL